jgi:hypothetical protein
MTLERPKSATMMSASSSGVRKRRFSGFRSGDVKIELHISTRCVGKRTAVNNATCVDVLDGLSDGADEAGGVPKDRTSVRSGTISMGHVQFVVVALFAYAVEELAAGAKVEAEIEVVLGLLTGPSTQRSVTSERRRRTSK